MYFGATAHSDGVPVLNYHQINDEAHNALTLSVEQFDAQMKYLHDNGYHAISPMDLYLHLTEGKELPDKPVLITFDDGYIDNYKNAVPILEKYGLKGTIFVITDYLNRFPNYLTWDEAKALNENGVLDVESHTMTHRILDELSDAELHEELVNSKQAIDMHLHKNVRFIAYPCGSYDIRIEKEARDAGYLAAFTVNYGLGARHGLFDLDRIPIFGGNAHTFLRFKLRLLYAPLFSPLDRFRYRIKPDWPRLSRYMPVP